MFEAFFDALASMNPSAHLIQMFDSTIVRAHVSEAGAKGGKTARPSVDRVAGSRRKSAQKQIVADKGYVSKVNRTVARARGVAPVIPHKANEKNKPAFFAKTIYKPRGRIEQAFGGLQRFKRVAKDRTELRTHRKFRCRPVLDQIRPHGLAHNDFCKVMF